MKSRFVKYTNSGAVLVVGIHAIEKANNELDQCNVWIKENQRLLTDDLIDDKGKATAQFFLGQELAALPTLQAKADDMNNCTEIEVTDADWQAAGAPSWWVDDKGAIRKPTTLEKSEREEALVKALAATALKKARDIALMSVVVDIDGNDIWANPTEEQNISGRIRQMDASGDSDCEWIQGFDVYVLTKAQLETVWASGTAQGSQIYDDYIAAIKAL